MGAKLTATLLSQLDTVPADLLNVDIKDLHEVLPGPTLIHIRGVQERPIFISVLQHGNEPTGFLAVQALIKKYQAKTLPRSISIFFGNIEAAKRGLRRLDGQPDFNRVWPGTDFPESAETLMTKQIVEEMKKRNVFASIDIHNNTGINPHYACVNILDPRYLQLATLFSRLVVYFIRPKGVQSAAFALVCPAVTLECGKPGQRYGVEHVYDYLEDCLHLNEIPDHPVSHRDIDLFHTVAQITVADKISFSFDHSDVDLRFNPNLDHMNFTEIPAGSVFGRLLSDKQLPVIATDENGDNVSNEFFAISGDELILQKSVMPSMLTLDSQIIRQDCLCYLMERISP